MNDSRNTEGKGQGPKQFQIQIDRKHYTVEQATMTGAEIRQLADPDIGLDRDLFEVVPGGSDSKVDTNDTIEIRNGMRFFSAPAQINPGR